MAMVFSGHFWGRVVGWCPEFQIGFRRECSKFRLNFMGGDGAPISDCRLIVVCVCYDMNSDSGLGGFLKISTGPH